MKKYRAKEAYLVSSIAQQYEAKRFASPLGRFVDWREKSAAVNLLEMLSINDDSRILDLPCGTGRLSRLLSENGHNVVAADVSLSMISVARGKTGMDSKVEFVVCDAEELPFSDGVFDCVVSLRFMGFLPPQIRLKVLGEMSRVTTNWLILFYHDPSSLMGIFRMIKNRLRGKVQEWYTVKPSDLEGELKAAGLSLAMTKPILGKLAETYAVLVTKMSPNEPGDGG